MKIFVRQFKLLFTISKRYFLLVVFVELFISLLPIFNIYILQTIFKFINVDRFSDTLYFLVFLYIGVCILTIFLGRLIEYISAKYLILVENYLINTVLLNTEKLTLEEFECPKEQNRIRRVVNKALDLFVSIFSICLIFFSNTIIFISSIVYLLQIDLWITVVIVILPLILIKKQQVVLNKKYEYDLKQTSKRKENWYITYTLTQSNAFQENKVNKYSILLVKKILDNNISFMRDKVFLFYYSLKKTFLWEICLDIFPMVALLIYFKNELFSLPSLIVFLQLINKIVDSEKSIVSSLNELGNQKFYLFELFNHFDRYICCKENYEETFEINIIELKNITYYKNKKIILSDVCLNMKKGNIYFIVGKNGSGKSTLSKVILGLYEKYTGVIILNQKYNIEEYGLNDYRSKCSVFFQDFYRFETTFKENIQFSEPLQELDICKVQKSIDELLFKEKFDEFPLGMETILGTWFENGVNLSGGEWQKVSLLRCLNKNADIYLLDEPISMLDTYTSIKVIQRLRELAKTKLVIIILHDYKFIKNSDNVIYINNGIVKQGLHRQLFETILDYRNLVGKRKEKDI
ncbi:ABC transporter ATP-binding protein [Carnobacteriaceae bacterium zg-ZUI78]|nr:ABC transporter ATP-binding protein [Carnobacteriaceae bacterium zg-ZUI78]